MVSDGFTPRFAETVDPSTTCSPGCPKTRWYGVDHAGRRPTRRSCSRRGSAPSSARRRPRPGCSPRSRRGARPSAGRRRSRPGSTSGWARRRPGADVSRVAPRQVRRGRTVIEAPPVCMTSPMTVRCDQLPRPSTSEATCPGCRSDGAQPAHRTRHPSAAVGQHRAQQAHEVGPPPVAHRFEVGVVVEVDRRRDGDAAGHVGAPSPAAPAGRRPAERLAVGARQHAEPVGEPGQGAGRLHPVQQLLRAPGPGGDDDLPGA